MAKALGLIGNFKGKLGNTVGYSLKDSNNKQTQGVRVYQPVVRNPKTAAQAEQRAKLAPINATYRALKMIIDRGQEGKAYGNKSRLAWLSEAMKAFNGAWYEKGAVIGLPAWVNLTKGSINTIYVTECGNTSVKAYVPGMAQGDAYATIGALTSALLGLNVGLKDGDQITIVGLSGGLSAMTSEIISIVLDSTSDQVPPCTVTPKQNSLQFTLNTPVIAGSVIVSREGDNGAHLRSTARLLKAETVDDDRTDAASKQAAIESYMSQGANTDWAEESLM